MGLSCIVVLLLMRLLVSVKIGPKDDDGKSTFHRVVNKIIWLTGTSRNAILVILTAMISFLLHRSGQYDLMIIGEIPSGMPAFGMPSFSIPDIRNETTGEIIQRGETFSEMISGFGSSLIVIPLIALLESISICKAFCKYNQKVIQQKKNYESFLISHINFVTHVINFQLHNSNSSG